MWIWISSATNKHHWQPATMATRFVHLQPQGTFPFLAQTTHLQLWLPIGIYIHHTTTTTHRLFPSYKSDEPSPLPTSGDIKRGEIISIFCILNSSPLVVSHRSGFFSCFWISNMSLIVLNLAIFESFVGWI